MEERGRAGAGAGWGEMVGQDKWRYEESGDEQEEEEEEEYLEQVHEEMEWEAEEEGSEVRGTIERRVVGVVGGGAGVGGLEGLSVV